MTKTHEGQASSAISRIVALILAVLLAVGAYFLWQQTAAMRAAMQAIPESGDLEALGTSDAATACKEQRFAEIESALKDGTLAEEDAARAREGAVNLCIMQNRTVRR